MEDELMLSSENVASDIELEILDLVNEYRLSNGLNVLEFDGIAYDYAAQHTDEMISDCQISLNNFDLFSTYLVHRAIRTTNLKI